MRRIGYARVSSSEQSLDRQIAVLRAERCDVIFREKVSGRASRTGPSLKRPSISSAPVTRWLLPNGTGRRDRCSTACI